MSNRISISIFVDSPSNKIFDLLSVVIGILLYTVNCLIQSNKATTDLVSTGYCISMSISGDSLSDETLNRGPWDWSCDDNMNFPFGIDIVDFQRPVTCV